MPKWSRWFRTPSLLGLNAKSFQQVAVCEKIAFNISVRLTMLSFQYWIYLIPPGWLVRHIANPGSKGNILLGSKVISLLLGMSTTGHHTFAIKKFWWYWLGLCLDSSLEFWFVLNFQLNITTSGLSGFPNIWSLTRTILNGGFNLDIGEQCF